MKKDILSILDITKDELTEILDNAARLKAERASGAINNELPRKTLGMIFEKASTRTRISFEAGMFELGGHALFLNPHDMQLGRGEDIKDTARVLSRFLSAIMIRAYSHSTVEELAANSSVPVINGLSDLEHPCQILADLLTLKEHFGDLSNLSVAWVGDGNNVCNSLILVSALTGFSVRVSTPKGYRPPAEILEKADKAGAHYEIFDRPEEAVKGVDAIFTDTWISMGDESEKKERIRAFDGYTVDETLLSHAASNAVVMHCLPAHRGEEITDSVIEGPRSLIWDEAENRMHAQKALLVMLLGKGSI